VQRDTPVTQVTLELEAGAGEAPKGALLTGDGLRRTFCGWIELASAIEDWRQSEHDTHPRGSEGGK
jgi:hypothetical protein